MASRPKMSMQRKRKLKVRTRKVVSRKEEAPAGYAEQQDIRSREGALLLRIVNKSDAVPVPEDSMLFISLLSNLTSSMREVSRHSGMYAGRHLYSLLSARKRYTIYEESIADLVKFFEHAGYEGVTYNVFPDRIDIQMHDKSHVQLGVNIHSFEAGLISGFVTAAKKQYVNVTEHVCSNNGSEFCLFSSYYGQYSKPEEADPKSAILGFVEHIAKDSQAKGHETELQISPEYYALSSSPVLEQEYHQEMLHVAAYIGSEIGSRIFDQRTKGSKAALDRFGRVISLLNLGKASVKSLDPVKIDIMFEKLHARLEFVELSLALINGLLKEHSVEGAKVSSSVKRDAYNVRISGKK